MDEGSCRIRGNKGNFKLKPEIKKESASKDQEKPKTIPKVHWIDRISRFAFPILYVLFLVSYTLYYGLLRDASKENVS